MATDHTPITLEVCVDSLTSAKTAAELGAQRIELNAALELGGLTPSIGLVEQVVTALQPLGCQTIAMVRPRPGGFAYSNDEVTTMQNDIDRLLDAGVDGVAMGVLDRQGEIEEQACQTLIKPVLDASKDAVFHRAIDLTPDAINAIDSLISIGFTRVLTSGGRVTALEGDATIRQMIERAAGRIVVLPGSGINASNAAQLIRETGCTQVHASLREAVEDTSGSHNPAIQFDSPPPANLGYHQADPDKITAMRAAINQR